jgi:hypothetical protein
MWFPLSRRSHGRKCSAKHSQDLVLGHIHKHEEMRSELAAGYSEEKNTEIYRAPRHHDPE